MTHNQPTAGRNGLQRSRTDRVLGGVCAGIAERFRLDALLVRVAAVALALVSAGAAVLAYLLAWIVIPSGTGRRPAPIDRRPGDDSLRDTWGAAGGELRSPATELRRPRPAPTTDPDTAQREASRAAAMAPNWQHTTPASSAIDVRDEAPPS